MKKLFSTSLLILAGMLLLLGSCKEDELPVSGEGNVANNELPVRLAETDYNPNNTYYLLNDNESQDVYFDSGQRSFYVSRPLQFGMDDEHCFQLRFYSPRALKNVTFWARIDGYEEEFKFMSLEKIMPFQQLRVHIPFATKDLTAYTRSGKKIRIMANPYLTEENLTFTVECDDPYWTRLQSIRCKWYIAFGRYSDTQDSWKYKMKASHTREAVAIALNMAYMFSSERFKTALYEFGPLHSNNDKAEIDKTALLANVLNHRGLTFGYTTGVMGLGGGTTFGMHEVCYLEHYADDKSITETIFHEFAHCVGYGHAGNMTYEQTGPGWITLCNNVYVALSLDKELPVYSRRFLHTRWSRNRYFDDIYVASKHIIEDPELDALGETPLPHSIINRPVEPDDAERFQSIFARNEGAVTAPTASLHFSRELMKRMEIKGIDFAYITLHAGLGNFRDIDVEDLTKHKTDSEQMIVNEEAVRIVNHAKDLNRQVCAVGTTVMRAIESTVSTDGHLKEYEGWTNKFIFPPYDFTVANAMISNFHMPLSTLLMIVAAFGGYEQVMEAYNVALKEEYRFGTYGDAMLITDR